MAEPTPQTNYVVLSRIDERTQRLQEDMREIKAKMQKDYVTHDEFEPVKKLVFGLVGIMLVGVVGALMALILR